MAKLTRVQAEKVVRIVFDSIHDRFYEPWEWNDAESLPEGFESWGQEGAADAYFAELEEKAVMALLSKSKRK